LLSLQRSSIAEVDAIIVVEEEGLCGETSMWDCSREKSKVRTLVRLIWLVGFAAQLKTPRQLPDVAVICKPYFKLTPWNLAELATRSEGRH
jgi:hypothetical protein